MMLEDSVEPVETENGGALRAANRLETPKSPKIFTAMLCCYTAFDADDPACCGRERSDGICINSRACMDLSADSLGVGCLTDAKKSENEIFKIGAYCCTCALKMPELRCTSVGKNCCFLSMQSFPFDKDYVIEPMCACCFMQCYPTVGCLQPAPRSHSSETLSLVGGGSLMTHSLVRDMIRAHKIQR